MGAVEVVGGTMFFFSQAYVGTSLLGKRKKPLRTGTAAPSIEDSW